MTQFFKFQILPLSPISILNLAKTCCQKLKPLRTTLTWGEKGVFSLRNRFSVLSQQFCPRLWKWTNVPHINVKHQFFKYSYFPSTINEWKKLDSNIWNSEALIIFKSKILKFIRPTSSSIFGFHNPIGVKPLTRLRLGLNHLRERIFKHSFQHTFNLLCSCGKEAETTFNFLLSCPNYFDKRLTHLRKIRIIIPNISEIPNSQINLFFLYRDTNATAPTNCISLISTTEYILPTK